MSERARERGREGVIGRRRDGSGGGMEEKIEGGREEGEVKNL